MFLDLFIHEKQVTKLDLRHKFVRGWECVWGRQNWKVITPPYIFTWFIVLLLF